ncbi:LacI family transcriptional regulator [Paraliobacillus quinghaiensis]|uniref:LacI family transcriptional regulator n=1 Tax=Paraliobacillus quinghaiensis TaxID=470815 RepID=A0A917TM69_9BACI|nr:LacI family DNA-binding transcriptional regulator [Paraliobacillus quinghaiensis]GGM28810.1 LacI family transcriptional regulator [Paraliobacillus quinghaiensis]
MNLTISDIAKLAGVSKATVSKVINNYHGVNEKTKKKVIDIINDTGYSPTFSAKSLATKKSNLIGVIYAGKIDVDFTHPFFNKVISTFKREVGLLGYDILMFANEQFKQDDGSYLDRCRHFSVDGCLIIAGDEIEGTIDELVKSEIPCVGIDIELNGPNSCYVTTDNEKLSAKIVEHFHKNNFRNIAYIGGGKDSFVSTSRKKGFIKMMNHYSLPLVEHWIESGDFFDKSGYQAMNRILDQKPYPQAVFAISDYMALGAIKAINERGLKVPEDIAIAGCDEIDASRYSSPNLTTMSQDKEKIGKLSAKMLQDLINECEVEPYFVDSKLIARKSCGSEIGINELKTL